MNVNNSLIKIKPGFYLLLFSNKMLKISQESFGLKLNKNFNKSFDVVLINNEIIIIQKRNKNYGYQR
jgi:hypothetical protein